MEKNRADQNEEEKNTDNYFKNGKMSRLDVHLSRRNCLNANMMRSVDFNSVNSHKMEKKNQKNMK